MATSLRSSKSLLRIFPKSTSMPRVSSLSRSSFPIHSLRPLQQKNLSTGVPSWTNQIRFNSSLAIPKTSPEEEALNKEAKRPDQPSYQITFTCKPCKTRSTHTISKQGYHHGTVLIQCPGCKSRHVISDHLKIFMDQASTLEDILRSKGADVSKLLKKGKLGIRDGALVGNEGEQDLEFWEDGSETVHEPPATTATEAKS